MHFKAMFGNAVLVATICTLSLAILGEAGRVEDAGAEPAEDLGARASGVEDAGAESAEAFSGGTAEDLGGASGVAGAPGSEGTAEDPGEASRVDDAPDRSRGRLFWAQSRGGTAEDLGGVSGVAGAPGSEGTPVVDALKSARKAHRKKAVALLLAFAGIFSRLGSSGFTYEGIRALQKAGNTALAPPHALSNPGDIFEPAKGRFAEAIQGAVYPYGKAYESTIAAKAERAYEYELLGQAEEEQGLLGFFHHSRASSQVATYMHARMPKTGVQDRKDTDVDGVLATLDDKAEIIIEYPSGKGPFIGKESIREYLTEEAPLTMIVEHMPTKPVAEKENGQYSCTWTMTLTGGNFVYKNAAKAKGIYETPLKMKAIFQLAKGSEKIIKIRVVEKPEEDNEGGLLK